MGNQVARTATRTSSDMTIPAAERNDRWLTPKPIIEAVTTKIGLGMFDLDPCGAPDHQTATRVYTLEAGDDGLRDPWWGQVWMNPPYGRMKLQWIDRFLGFYRAGVISGGMMLIPYDPGQKAVWQHRMAREADVIFAWPHRIDFWSRDNLVGNMPSGKRMQSVTESAIVAFGEHAANALMEATERDLFPGGWATRYLDKIEPLPSVVEAGKEAIK